MLTVVKLYGMPSDIFPKKEKVDEVIKYFRGHNIQLLARMNFSFVNSICKKVENKKTNRGRKKEYKYSQNFQAVIYGLVNGANSIRGISRVIDTNLVKFIIRKENIQSYSTIDRFWNFLSEVIEKIFEALVEIMANYEMIGNEYAIDGTSIEVPQTDPGGKWNYDATKEEFYYGYGLAIVVDVETELPISAKFTRQKKLNKSIMEEIITKAVKIKKPTVLLGDSEFDVISIIKNLIEQKVLPVVKYNPRNSKEELSVKYRAEKIVSEMNDSVTLNRKELDKEYRTKRPAVERSNGILKTLGLEEPPILGKEHVKTSVYFVLIQRILIAISKYEENPEANLRRITT